MTMNRVATLRAKDISCVTTERHAARREALHHHEHLLDELGVERGGDLVEEHQVGAHRERACDRNALLLTSAELPGMRVRLVLEPDFAQVLDGAGTRLGARHVEHVLECERDVLAGRLVREQVELLEDDPDLGARGSGRCGCR
jgi:hypothetical protein